MPQVFFCFWGGGSSVSHSVRRIQGFYFKIWKLARYPGLTFDLVSQLPRERRGADEARRRPTARQNPAEVGPAPGGDARDGQLQLRDAGREGFLVRRRGSDRQPDVPHQQGAPGQDPPGVRTFLPTHPPRGEYFITSITVVVLELTSVLPGSFHLHLWFSCLFISFYLLSLPFLFSSPGVPVMSSGTVKSSFWMRSTRWRNQAHAPSQQQTDSLNVRKRSGYI